MGRKLKKYTALPVILFFLLAGCNNNLLITEKINNEINEQALEILNPHDSTLPEVIGFTPDDNSIGIVLETTLTIQFSESMNPETINENTITIKNPASLSVGFSVVYNDDTFSAVITPNELLSDLTLYTVVVTQNVQDKTRNGLKSEYTWDFTTIETGAPYNGSIIINVGDSYTNDLEVNLDLSAQDDGTIEEMRISNNSEYINDVNWIPFQASYTFTLIMADDGIRTVYAWFKDDEGKISSRSFDSIIYDNTAPTGSIIIDNANEYTKNTSINHTIAASDAAPFDELMMRISSSSSYADDSWVACSVDSTGTISSGDGAKTIYIWFKDPAGNISTAYNDSIILDTGIPVGSIDIESSAAYTNKTIVALTVAAADAVASAELSMRISSSSTYSDDSWVSFIANPAAALNTPDGTKTLYIWFKDPAGNVSTSYNDSITLDTTAPTGTISIESNATYTNKTTVNLAVTASDVFPFANLSMRISSSSTYVNSGWVTCAASATANLAAPDGAKSLYIWFKDPAGNISTSFTDSIVFDQTAPTGTIKIENGAAQTNKTTVTLTVTATDIAPFAELFMRISTSATYVNDSWVACISSPTKTIAAPDGTKTFYVWFKDPIGYISSTSASDSIVLDTVAPSISSHTPAVNATGVSAVTPNITITFNDIMLVSTLTTANLKITDSLLTPITCTVTVGTKDNSVTITPSVRLKSLKKYTVYVSSKIKDSAGNAIVSYSWSFTTG